MDLTDLKILALLEKDGRISKAKMSRFVGLTAAAVGERLRKLEASGVVVGYRADFDPAVLGFEVLAYVFVKDNDPGRRDQTFRQLAELEHVEEVGKITGDDAFLVKVRAQDTAALAGVLENGFGSIETVASTRTCIVLGPLVRGRWLELEFERRMDSETGSEDS